MPRPLHWLMQVCSTGSSQASAAIPSSLHSHLHHVRLYQRVLACMTRCQREVSEASLGFEAKEDLPLYKPTPPAQSAQLAFSLQAVPPGLVRTPLNALSRERHHSVGKTNLHYVLWAHSSTAQTHLQAIADVACRQGSSLNQHCTSNGLLRTMREIWPSPQCRRVCFAPSHALPKEHLWLMLAPW